ncbi:glycosyltransferase family 2 protein [Nonomuraea sp. NPDC050328]|uniref:glycosyltransferase family 2 protein n=1 Tax=Nonomuraea sp. NPDC050328 TaxID=3364361 RepID=UPI00378BCF13
MVTVVIPTVGRASLRAAIPDGLPVIVVDDRPGEGEPLDVPAHVRVLRSGGRGPAAARNVGWRAAGTEWVVFLDDDVVPGPGWTERLAADLAVPGIDGSQGRIEVPLPTDRRPTDAERNTAGLATAEWITADLAYRRAALEEVGGFEERFPRAYREDADLALRLAKAGFRLARGERVTVHPVRDDGWFASVHRQRGNADDALMRRLHGREWRSMIGATGLLPRHALTTLLLLLSGRSRLAFLGWAALTAKFAWERIEPGPRTPEEIVTMVVTSALIPPAACFHRLRGELRLRLADTALETAPALGVQPAEVAS